MHVHYAVHLISIVWLRKPIWRTALWSGVFMDTPLMPLKCASSHSETLSARYSPIIPQGEQYNCALIIRTSVKPQCQCFSMVESVTEADEDGLRVGDGAAGQV